MVGGSGYGSKYISRLCNFGYDAKNDNMPAPKNIPTLTGGTGTTTVQGFIFEECNSYLFRMRLCEGRINEIPKFVYLTITYV